MDLHGLASFIKIRNVVDEEIARTIGRPAHPGHIAEYIAAAIFDIQLEVAANTKAVDGQFRSGPLAGKSVNIKSGTRKQGMLNVVASADPTLHSDCYLVLSGQGGDVSSSGQRAPWVIRQVLLFDANDLLQALALKGIKLGVGTSVNSALWKAAMIYPDPVNPTLVITPQQHEALRLFWGSE